jgi:GWxTD domain-containing protein
MSQRFLRRTPAFIPALSACALLAAAAPAAAQHEFPVASLGDIWFQADHAGFQDAEGRMVQEFYFRITNTQVRFLPAGEEDPLRAAVFIKLEFRDEEEDKLGEATRRFEFTVPTEEIAESADFAQILLMREEIDPRARFVKIEVEDLNSRKRGLLYAVTGKKKNGTAEGILEPPPFRSGDAFAASDLQFAWTIEPANQVSDFEKNGLNVVPNPARTYGLLQPEVAAYYEVYEPESEGDSRVYALHHEVTSSAGTVVFSTGDTVSVRGRQWARVVRIDASQFPGGQYVLRCTISGLDGGREAVAERGFGLVWGRDPWNRTEEEVLMEARVLYTEKEYERFEAMSTADREVYLEQFWAQHDPTPDTRDNELREEFGRRVRYANRQFSAFGRKGMVTDRGRIYIRFGEPDEVERETLPTRERQLDALVDDLDDKSITARNLLTTDEFDVRPYEVWTYTSTGYPLFPEREFTTSVTGFRFVFVDETGTGHWILRYSSDFINY